MPDLELIDRLVATYRILNHTVRLKSEAELAQGGNSPKAIIRQLRDDELRFSQELKARLSGQQVEIAESADEAGMSSADSMDTTNEYIAQFGNLARTTNTLILPANVGDVAGMIATAMSVVKATAPTAVAPAPRGT